MKRSQRDNQQALLSHPYIID